MKQGVRIEAIERFAWLVLSTLGFFLFVLMFARFFILSPGTVDGPSMEPTFLDQDRIFVIKSSYIFKSPKRFDIVQIISPYKDKYIIKRIIGLPGETVSVKQGKIFITLNNGKEHPLDESRYLSAYIYTEVPGQRGVAQFVVGENEYFLVGDNRGSSADSRVFGSIHRSDIIGRVIYD